MAANRDAASPRTRGATSGCSLGLCSWRSFDHGRSSARSGLIRALMPPPLASPILDLEKGSASGRAGNRRRNKSVQSAASPKKPAVIRTSGHAQGQIVLLPERRGRRGRNRSSHMPDENDGAQGEHEQPAPSSSFGSAAGRRARRSRRSGPSRRASPRGIVDAQDDEVGLLRQVSVPDDQELGEEEIGGDHAEGQDQLAQVVELRPPMIAPQPQPARGEIPRSRMAASPV